MVTALLTLGAIATVINITLALTTTTAAAAWFTGYLMSIAMRESKS